MKVFTKWVSDPFPNPKNRPLGPQKVKNDPRIKSKTNVIIEGNIENKSYSTTWVDKKAQHYHKIRSKTKVIIEEGTENKTFSSLREGPKRVFETDPSPKNSPFGPPKSKKTLKLSQNQK